MKLKQVIGNHAHWTINKELANELGLDATIVLQHFIDLQYNFFEDGGFYQQQSRLVKDLPLTLDYLRKATNILKSKDFVTIVKRGIPSKNHYTVNEKQVLSFLLGTTSHASEAPLDEPLGLDQDKETNKTKKQKTNIEEMLGKIFFKIVEVYPKNRIGNRQHGLKKFEKLDIEQAKLAGKNLKRYLTAAGSYVKSLQNYIEEECYSEEWLKAEETKDNNKGTESTVNNFNGKY
tara:strand:- start:563 stop:1261 length:699 start_codon:yes stop_codon:yes gene_type:complete